MTALFLALFVHSVLPQDNRVRELVEKLDRGGIEERAEAEHELLRLGEAALPALRAAARSGGTELNVRAGRVAREVELDVALRARYGESKRVTVRAKAERLDR